MLDTIQRGLVAKLTWPQFLDLLDKLAIDRFLFNENTSPAERAWAFDDQIAIIAASRSLDQAATDSLFKDAIQAILGSFTSTALVKEGSQLVLPGLAELLTLAADPARQSAILKALAPFKNSLAQLEEGLVTMTRSKQAHAALHDLSFKIPLLLKAARDWKSLEPTSSERGRLTFELKKVSGACLDDIQRFSLIVQQLPPPSDTIFGNIADLMNFAISEVRDAINDPSSDPEAPVTSVLQPNVRQEPSKLQNLIALYASSLPFDQVISSFAACDFTAKAETLAALGGLRDGTAGIESQHHDWQFVNNQIRGMADPLENLTVNSFNRLVAASLLRPLRAKIEILCPSDSTDPIDQEIILLSKKVSDQLAEKTSDVWNLRADFEELLRLISSRFYVIDESLLEACRDMEPLCSPLRRLANLI